MGSRAGSGPFRAGGGEGRGLPEGRGRERGVACGRGGACARRARRSAGRPAQRARRSQRLRRRHHVDGHELRVQELPAAAPGQGQLPAGPLRRVQELPGEVHEVSPREQLRERAVQTRVQGVPGVPDGQATDGTGTTGKAGVWRFDGWKSKQTLNVPGRPQLVVWDRAVC